MPNINNICGWESGTRERIKVVGELGTPTVQSTTKRTGTYGLELLGNATVAQSNVAWISAGTTDGGNGYIFGFAIRFTNLAIASTQTFFAAVPSATASADIKLRLEADGDCIITTGTNVIAATVTNPFTVNTWHFVELYYTKSDTGTAELFIDDVSKATVSSADFNINAISNSNAIFQGFDATGQDVYVDDFYVLSGAASSAARLTSKFEVSKAYQKTDGGATDVGSALSTGTWANASERPENQANAATYNAGLNGGMTCNTGTQSGPSGDAAIPAGATIKVAKYFMWAKRSAGAASTHVFKCGNNTDGMTDTTVSLDTGYDPYHVCSESATIAPTSSEYVQLGMGSSGGGQSMTVSDMWGFIGYVKSAGRKRFYMI